MLKTISINFPNVFVDLNIVNKDIKSKHINIVSLVKSVIRVFSTLALTRRFKKNQDAKYKDIISKTTAH